MKNIEPNRKSFAFYWSFKDTINQIPDDKDKLQVYESITDFAFLGKEPENLTPFGKIAWSGIKQNLIISMKRYDKCVANGSKGAKYGAKGGRPLKEEKPQEKPQNDNDKEKNNLDMNYYCSDKPHDIGEVISFFKERCNAKDWEYQAKEFYYFFDAIGWVSRDPEYEAEEDEEGIPIKNWRAVATTWIKNWSNMPRYRNRLKLQDAKRKY